MVVAPAGGYDTRTNPCNNEGSPSTSWRLKTILHTTEGKARKHESAKHAGPKLSPRR